MIARRTLFITLLTLACGAARSQQFASPGDNDREARHRSAEWLTVAPHLPDMQTGTPAALQTAGDVLRARRMPEDAIEYYRAAFQRGGDESATLNRIGITLLELHDTAQAKACFKRAVMLKAKNAETWNNLGASEYIGGNYTTAIQDYKRAVKLNKKTAVYRSNLGTAYFEVKDFESAEKQFETALRLDPEVFQHGGSSGIEAHVLSPANRGRFCFEMARLEARRGNDAGVMQWLAKAAETNFDIRAEMVSDKSLAAYRGDARVLVLVKNAKAMRAGLVAAAGPAPALPAEVSPLN